MGNPGQEDEAIVEDARRARFDADPPVAALGNGIAGAGTSHRPPALTRSARPRNREG
jgi:hypothetical protein